jgi:hypothetical protein
VPERALEDAAKSLRPEELQVSGLSAASVNGLTVRAYKALAGVVSTQFGTVPVYAFEE